MVQDFFHPQYPPAAAPTSPTKEEARRKERQALFRILDTDSSGALDAKEPWEMSPAYGKILGMGQNMSKPMILMWLRNNHP